MQNLLLRNMEIAFLSSRLISILRLARLSLRRTRKVADHVAAVADGDKLLNMKMRNPALADSL